MSDPTLTLKKIAIIGMGLMGGSFAAALKQKKMVTQLCGYDTNADSLVKAEKLGLITESASSIAEAVKQAQLIVIAVPVLAIEQVLAAIKDSGCLDANPKPLITDMSSVKSHVIEAAIKVFGQLPDTLVPGHPIAGSERHGVEAADADLFFSHKVILTPTPATSAQALEKIEKLWQHIGSEVVQMDAGHHDQVLAQTSHLPHLLAYSLVDTLSNQPDGKEIFKYAAGGFRDFSRIAASDPTMWRDIFKANHDAILDILDKFTADLAEIRELMKTDEMDVLAEKLAKAKEARDYFSQLNPSSGPSKEGSNNEEESGNE